MCEEKERYETREGETAVEFLLKAVVPLSLACLIMVWGIWVAKIVFGV